MKKDEIRSLAYELLETVPGNILTEDMDIDPRFSGIRLFDAPLVGFGSASVSLFAEYKKPGIIGPWHMSPEEWLPGAKSVISIFLPFTEEVRSSNRDETEHASTPWLYARIEGQAFIIKYIAALAARLEEQGFRCCIPQTDPRWQAVHAGGGIEGYDAFMTPSTYGSRWSERHAAFVCGLGTFGLSKGLITERGIAGRFCSLVTVLPLEPDIRPYLGVYDNCIHCNACVQRCPVGAIDPVTGKDHPTCHRFLGISKELFAPRYGCGLCQTGVPCEAENPLHLMD